MLKKMLVALVASAFALGTVYAQVPQGETKGEPKAGAAKAKKGAQAPKGGTKGKPKADAAKADKGAPVPKGK